MNVAGQAPFDRSYWVLPGTLLAGCYPGELDPEQARKKLQGLVNAGIQHVITLMEVEESSRFIPYMPELTEIAAAYSREISSVRLPIRDVSVPSKEAMVAILDEIDKSMQVLSNSDAVDTALESITGHAGMLAQGGCLVYQIHES